LSDNKISGNVPSSLTNFKKLKLYLQNNRIQGLDDGVCDMKMWNDGDVGKYGCDGILCSTGHYSPSGRQSSSSSKCKECEGSVFFGATKCPHSPSKNKVTTQLFRFAPAIFIFSCLILGVVTSSYRSRKRNGFESLTSDGVLV